MFDYDQRRSTLPSNGSYYCVPTSYVNVWRYMSQHGMPLMDGGWPAGYDSVSSWILLTGLGMGTDPTKGTNHGYAYDFGKTWVANNTSKPVLHWRYRSDANWSFNTIRNHLRMGALVNIGRGKYKLQNGAWSRIGGHMVTVAGFSSDGQGNQTLRVMDPASDEGDNTRQSTYAIDNKATGHITLTTEDDGQVTHARYTFSTTGGHRWVVDNMHSMLPHFAGWPGGSLDSTTFKFHFPFQWDESPTFGWPRTFEWTTTETVLDWQWDVKDMSLVYLASTGAVKQVDIFDNTVQTLATVSGAMRLVVGGPMHDVYVHAKPPLQTDRIHYIPRKGGIGAVTPVGFRAAILDYDEFYGGPVLTDADGTRLVQFSRFGTNPVHYPLRKLETGLPISSAAGPVMMKVDQLTGDALVAHEGDSKWYRYSRKGSRYVGIAVPFRGSGLEAIMPTERGLVVVQLDGRLWTLDRNGLPSPGDFDGLQVEGKFKMVRSGSVGMNPMDTPGWEDEPPGVDEP